MELAQKRWPVGNDCGGEGAEEWARREAGCGLSSGMGSLRKESGLAGRKSLVYRHPVFLVLPHYLI